MSALPHPGLSAFYNEAKREQIVERDGFQESKVSYPCGVCPWNPGQGFWPLSL